MPAVQLFSIDSLHLLVFSDLICVLHKLASPNYKPCIMFRQNTLTKFNSLTFNKERVILK